MRRSTYAVTLGELQIGTIARSPLKRPHSWLAKSIHFRAEALCGSKGQAQAWLEATHSVATLRGDR